MPGKRAVPFKLSRHLFLAAVAVPTIAITALGLLPVRTFSSLPGAQVQAAEVPAPVTADQTTKETKLTIDYPEDGSIFPPGITPPTMIWRDASADSWHITISFADHAQEIRALSTGERMKIAPIDPDCIAKTNKLPELTPQQAESWVWTPDARTWTTIQLHTKETPATLTITGYHAGIPSSESRIKFITSADKVGAPIFYRDVPLMPTQNTDGTVQPLAGTAIHLIKWRLRDIRQPESRTVLTNVPTCLNCHSFSADGKTMGIDLDGPNNDKGLYAVVPTAKHITIDNAQVVKWNTDGVVGKIRVGFMSRISPDGKYVLSTFGGANMDVPSSFYIRNFTDYRFLQVFYPTRGILEWYSKETGKRQPCRAPTIPNTCRRTGCGRTTANGLCSRVRLPATRARKAKLRPTSPTTPTRQRFTTTFIEFHLTVVRAASRNRSLARQKTG